MKNDIIPVGYVRKIHGVQGALRIEFKESFNINNFLNEPVFLEIKGKPVPFFISKIIGSEKSSAILSFDDINTIQAAEKLAGCRFMIELKKGEKASEKDQLKSIENYKVIDQNFGELGKVLEIMELPMQTILRLEFRGKEILIPLNEETLIGINKRKKIVELAVPDGLIDLYLDEN